MLIKAKLKHLRIAPRKVRLVTGLIRGKSTEKAEAILDFTPQRSSKQLLKLLKSVIANAKNNFQIEESNLYISKLTVDEGPKYKRWHPQSRGRAYEIQKKTSHITIELDEIEKKATKKKAIKKKISPVKEDKIEKSSKSLDKPKLKPKLEIKKPKIEKSINRIFRRKSF